GGVELRVVEATRPDGGSAWLTDDGSLGPREHPGLLVEHGGRAQAAVHDVFADGPAVASRRHAALRCGVQLRAAASRLVGQLVDEGGEGGAARGYTRGHERGDLARQVSLQPRGALGLHAAERLADDGGTIQLHRGSARTGAAREVLQLQPDRPGPPYPLGAQ